MAFGQKDESANRATSKLTLRVMIGESISFIIFQTDPLLAFPKAGKPKGILLG
jgi:hypothetical protein